MKKQNRCIALALLTTLLTTQNAVAQAIIDGFMTPKNKGAVSLSYSYESFDEFYFANQRMDAPGRLGGQIATQSIGLYANYGISDRFNVVFNLPYIIAQGDGNENVPQEDGSFQDQQVEDFQDIAVYLKYKSYEHTFGAGQLSIIPAVGFGTPLSDYAADDLLSVGNGATFFDMRGIVHFKSNAGFFIEGQAGHSFRSDEVPDAWIFAGKLGYAHEKFYLDFGFQTQVSESDAPDIGEAVFSATRVNYTQLAFSAYYPVLPALGVSAGVGQYIDGRNVGRATRLSGGVVYSF